MSDSQEDHIVLLEDSEEETESPSKRPLEDSPSSASEAEDDDANLHEPSEDEDDDLSWHGPSDDEDMIPSTLPTVGQHKKKRKVGSGTGEAFIDQLMTQAIDQTFQAAGQNTQAAGQNTQAASQNTQAASQNTQDCSQVSYQNAQAVHPNTQASSQNAQALNQDAQASSQNIQASNQDAQVSSQSAQVSSQASNQNTQATSQNAQASNQNVQATNQVSRGASKKKRNKAWSNPWRQLQYSDLQIGQHLWVAKTTANFSKGMEVIVKHWTISQAVVHEVGSSVSSRIAIRCLTDNASFMSQRTLNRHQKKYNKATKLARPKQTSSKKTKTTSVPTTNPVPSPSVSLSTSAHVPLPFHRNHSLTMSPSLGFTDNLLIPAQNRSIDLFGSSSPGQDTFVFEFKTMSFLSTSVGNAFIINNRKHPSPLFTVPPNLNLPKKVWQVKAGTHGLPIQYPLDVAEVFEYFYQLHMFSLLVVFLPAPAFTYMIDLEKMTQHNLDTGAIRAIERIDVSIPVALLEVSPSLEPSHEVSFEEFKKLCPLPKEWDEKKAEEVYESSEGFSLIKMDQKTELYTKITQFLRSGHPTYTGNIVEVHQIINPQRWQDYINFVAKTRRINKTTPEEIFVIHGTDKRTAFIIAEERFNYRFNTTALHGKGNYFSTSFQYVIDRGYAMREPDNSKYVLICKFCVGNTILGTQNMLLTNTKTQTAVDNVQNPTIYVGFDDNQAYPLYLVKIQE